MTVPVAGSQGVSELYGRTRGGHEGEKKTTVTSYKQVRELLIP